MRIAYITYEYPPDTGKGGIATYVYQVARLMKSRGHQVEVFCGSNTRNETGTYDDIMTHRIRVKDPAEFRTGVVEPFSERHHLAPFDLFESPEINGNGYEIKKKFPDLPMVVKIHMPAVLQLRLQHYYTPLSTRIRFTLSSLLKKGTFDLGWWSRHDKNQYGDIDYLTTDLADAITTPSQAMKEWAVRFWRIDSAKIRVVPLPFDPEPEYLNIPVNSDHGRVLFIGKLNVHKGVVNLARAIPAVLKKYPATIFRFVAPDGPSPHKGVGMKDYLLQRLKGFEESLEFIGAVPLHEIPGHLDESDFCIFPSLWECFGLVVCEAMAAGRVPIFSSKGGMKEIAEHGFTGIMVNPHRPKQMAGAMIRLIAEVEERNSIARNARISIQNRFTWDRLGPLYESEYAGVLT